MARVQCLWPWLGAGTFGRKHGERDALVRDQALGVNENSAWPRWPGAVVKPKNGKLGPKVLAFDQALDHLAGSEVRKWTLIQDGLEEAQVQRQLKNVEFVCL